MNPLDIDLQSILAAPGFLLGSGTYLLIAASVLMRNIAWLRALAILGGVGKIAYRTVFVYDPTSVFWESVFVAINLVQLAIIWWENREPNFSPEERRFIETVAPGLSPGATRALVQSGRWDDVPAGTTLTVAGEMVNALIFISHGTVLIESGGTVVATCSDGDFLGEMTYANRKAATATAVTSTPTRLLRFERQSLEAVQEKRPVLRSALQASFNRNLIDKLTRANAAPLQRAS